MVTFRELNDRVLFDQELGESAGQIMFVNTFHVAREDEDEFLAAW
jgi:hypothetical protein